VALVCRHEGQTASAQDVDAVEHPAEVTERASRQNDVFTTNSIAVRSARGPRRRP
jgi:hypothetical protein